MRACLEDYADVANGLYELHVATGELRWLEESRRLAAARRRSLRRPRRRRLLPDPEGRRGARREEEGLRRSPDAVGEARCSPTCCSASPGIWGDHELERQAVGVFRFVAPLLPRAPSAFGHALNALDLHFSPPREIAIVWTPDSEWREQRWRRSTRTRWSLSGRATRCRSWPGRTWSTGARRSTSAKPLPVRHPVTEARALGGAQPRLWTS